MRAYNPEAGRPELARPTSTVARDDCGSIDTGVELHFAGGLDRCRRASRSWGRCPCAPNLLLQLIGRDRGLISAGQLRAFRAP